MLKQSYLLSHCPSIPPDSEAQIEPPIVWEISNAFFSQNNQTVVHSFTYCSAHTSTKLNLQQYPIRTISTAISMISMKNRRFTLTHEEIDSLDVLEERTKAH